jgi:hypothetical protein
MYALENTLYERIESIHDVEFFAIDLKTWTVITAACFQL